MVGVLKRPMDMGEAFMTCGGFVRYFGTNEPVIHIAKVMEGRQPRRVLACCGGGDQALTFLGLAKEHPEVYAFDMNPAQLFVLACKARLLEEGQVKTFSPSFDRISRSNLGRIRALPQDVRRISRLVNIPARKAVRVSADFAGKFGFEVDSGMYDYCQKNVYWANDKRFIMKIRASLAGLKAIHADALSVADWFAREYLDIIYVSDIPLHNAIPFYLERLRALVDRLSPGGLVIGNAEDQQELDRCPSIIEVMRCYKELFGLLEFRQEGQIVALMKTGAKKQKRDKQG